MIGLLRCWWRGMHDPWPMYGTAMYRCRVCGSSVVWRIGVGFVRIARRIAR